MPSVTPLLNGYSLTSDQGNLAAPPSTDFGTPRASVERVVTLADVVYPGHDRPVRVDAGGEFDYTADAVPLEFRVP